jgi:Arc/MetJ-type ribon-helix-helix transcriptional regulator
MRTTERLVVDLPSDLVAGLRASVRSGAFGSESEALEVLLRTWYGDEGAAEPDIETLRAFVAEGVADVDAGRTSDAEEVYARVLARIDEFAAQKAK